jgi:hypothetical protein
MATELEERLAALEVKVKEFDGIALTRKTPGDISAAVRGAQALVSAAEFRLNQHVESRQDETRRNIEALRAEIRKLQDYIDGAIKNAVENYTVQTFEDYGVVSDLDGKRITVK